MSFPSIEIVCGKCGGRINKTVNLKAIRDILRPTNGKCNSCGCCLNPYDFSLLMEKF